MTRPGSFRSCQDGYAVKSSLKAEDGLLYPLEKGFFFLPKPPTLILHDEVHIFFLFTDVIIIIKLCLSQQLEVDYMDRILHCVLF